MKWIPISEVIQEQRCCFIAVSGSTAPRTPRAVCTPSDQTPFKFTLFIVMSRLLLLEHKASGAVGRLSFKIPSPWVISWSILPAYEGFTAFEAVPKPRTSHEKIPTRAGSILLQRLSLSNHQGGGGTAIYLKSQLTQW